MSMRQSDIWPILCQLMAILAKLVDMDFKFVLFSIYINFNIQTNFEKIWSQNSKNFMVYFWVYFWGKTNLKSLSTNLANMAINWHHIGQMQLWRMDIKRA